LNYTVSRNGQTYGPYTLEDLRRYIASGNVLPTDLARNETMPDWVPVAQILATPQAPPPPPPATQSLRVPGDDASPFAAPLPLQPAAALPIQPVQAYYAQPPAAGFRPAAFNPSAYPDAPDLHWGILLVLAIFTNGLFLIIWDFVVTVWLRKVQPNSKALMWYIISYSIYVVLVILIIAIAATASTASSRQDTDFHASYVVLGVLFIVASTAGFVTQIIARFSERASLLEHFNGPEPVGLRLSGVMTFFFSGLYFQYHLNRIKQQKDAMRFGLPRPF
jgi:hypothetical protein